MYMYIYARMSCTRKHARRTCCSTRTRTPAHRHACSFLARKYKILSPVIYGTRPWGKCH